MTVLFLKIIFDGNILPYSIVKCQEKTENIILVGKKYSKTH